ncbi:hypothetical protein CRG98_013239 [Punica granatum]|uniref:Uncharacterized protein n=1 Tax=Punica granatum TaxID=22663 RepID=A0A2I0KD39_PUNGR|nr:hypothetical protein CRG98_013239 [Punica granatum]
MSITAAAGQIDVPKNAVQDEAKSSSGKLSRGEYISLSYFRVKRVSSCTDPNVVLVGARMCSTEARGLGVPSRGCMTDTRKKESSLPVYDPKVESR